MFLNSSSGKLSSVPKKAFPSILQIVLSEYVIKECLSLSNFWEITSTFKSLVFKNAFDFPFNRKLYFLKNLGSGKPLSQDKYHFSLGYR